MPRILVIDDDRTVPRLIERTFEGQGVEVVAAANAADGMMELRRAPPDAVLLDIMLPESNGLEVARQIRELDAKLPIIFITVTEDSSTAIEAIKLGAYDYLLKPLDRQQVQELVQRAFETRRLMQSPVHMQPAQRPESGDDVLVGRSPQMLELYKQIGRVAAQDVSVLLRGESGTGKELVARAIYHHSHRKDRCFLAVNCAALSDTLLESELFGHEKGAFTGADRRHIGKFERCNGGTLFLDEIGDMSPSTQSKVLRVLQEQQFERIGGTETIETDVRIISATNRDIEGMIADGKFRLDLYHRLNTFEIVLPPLRDRQQDLELLIEHFLADFGRKLGRKVSGVSPEAMQLLAEHPWPGNVRELQAALGKAILMATGPVLVPEFLPSAIVNQEQSQPPEPQRSNADTDFARFLAARQAAASHDLYAESLQWMERLLLQRVLQETQGNQSKAAEWLGITRSSLRHKIKTLGLTIDSIVRTSAHEN